MVNRKCILFYSLETKYQIELLKLLKNMLLKYNESLRIRSTAETISFKSRWDTCGFTLHVLVHNYPL